MIEQPKSHLEITKPSEGQISLFTQEELKAMERGDCDGPQVDSD